MQTIQINGTFSFINNIKKLKIGDPIKLIQNENNKLTSEAIGAYTINGNKIGYIPFKISQININDKYWVEKISLNQHNPLLLIAYKIVNCHIIPIQPKNIYKDKLICSKLTIPDKYKNDIIHLTKQLKMKGNKVNNIMISYYDDNFINLHIDNNIFYTVTKKYYEDNIFKYDEFYNLGLIPNAIYQLFQIHRLEKYIERNYKEIKPLKGKCQITKFEEIKCDIDYKNCMDFELIKQSILYYISHDTIYYTDNILKLNIDNLLSLYSELKPGGICYNHEQSSYCYISLYNDDNIIEIVPPNYILDINNMYNKLILSCKNIINIYNPIKKNIIKIKISDIQYI